MTKLSIAVQTIKDSVSALDVGQAIGLEIRRGRCQCPIHKGKDFNCVLYKGDRGFFCHVCHAGGDVIKLVQEYYGMQFKDSVSWINATFRLGLDLEGKIDPERQKQAENALKMRKKAIEYHEWKGRMQLDLHQIAGQILTMLEDMRDGNVPKTPNEEWSDEFCEAVRTIPEARMFVEETALECIGVKE